MCAEYTIIHTQFNVHTNCTIAILTHARMHARTHTDTQTHTHTRTHTNTHTHTHMHSITVSMVKERPISRGNTAAYIHIHTHTYILTTIAAMYVPVWTKLAALLLPVGEPPSPWCDSR